MASRHSDDPAERRGISRRALLRTSAVAGGSLLAASAVPGAAFAKGPLSLSDAVPPLPTSIGLTFFSNPALDFNARFALGAAGYGSAEVGEVVAAINAANEAGGTLQSFVDSFSTQADRTGAYAAQARAAGRKVTAREAHLRAAEYYAQALFFVLGTSTPSNEADLYAAGRRHWEAACKLFDPEILEVRIPYEGSSIPGYFMRPDASGKARPTVIVNNGSDAQTVETYAYGGAAAIERGYNALLFEGPGQGAMLFEREIPFRPDWEKVITPIVDWLEKRSDVDESRIALTGWSMAGELVIRAAAFEPRLAAVVADPGCVDVWLAWPESARALAAAGDAQTVNQTWQQDAVPSLTPAQAFDMKKRGEIFGKEFLLEAREGKVPSDFALLASRVQEYTNAAVIDRVKAPVLVTNYELEQFYPGQAQQLFMLLPGQKDYVTFTVAEGAEYHCAPMAPQLRNEVVFNWLSKTLANPRKR